MRSADMTKDQTYYLSSVPEAQLSRVGITSTFSAYQTLIALLDTGAIPPRRLEEDRSSRTGEEVRVADGKSAGKHGRVLHRRARQVRRLYLYVFPLVFPPFPL